MLLQQIFSSKITMFNGKQDTTGSMFKLSCAHVPAEQKRVGQQQGTCHIFWILHHQGMTAVWANRLYNQYCIRILHNIYILQNPDAVLVFVCSGNDACTMMGSFLGMGQLVLFLPLHVLIKSAAASWVRENVVQSKPKLPDCLLRSCLYNTNTIIYLNKSVPLVRLTVKAHCLSEYHYPPSQSFHFDFPDQGWF